MPAKHVRFVAALLCAVFAAAQDCPAQDALSAAGLHRDVVFSDYAPASASLEILHRMLTPLAYDAAQQSLARSQQKLAEQPVDLTRERFTVYVPPTQPAAGYGLLVFVPPWNEARLPDGWASVLDAHGMIFVTAAHSGNDQGVVTRRAPLALLAEENVARRFRIDPARIYVSGFSGGSRVAMRLALAYPDIFSGAFLNAGADPIGDAAAPLPSLALFARFQENSRLYYATGSQDLSTLGMDARSLHAMRDLCVFHVNAERTPRAAHEIANPQVLFGALAYLDAPPQQDADRLASCRNDVQADLQKSLQDIRDAIGRGRLDEARALSLDADKRFGGLAGDDLSALSSALYSNASQP